VPVEQEAAWAPEYNNNTWYVPSTLLACKGK
jgi:hypothetical protein